MKTKKLIIAAVTLVLLGLLLVACEKEKDKTAEKKEPVSKQETVREPEAKEPEKTEETDKEEKKEKDEPEEQTVADTKQEDKAAAAGQETGSANDTSAKNNSKSTGKKAAKKTKKVWVEPVYETRTVNTGLGTTYCNGANSGGGCGASWHGTKEATYQSWKAHWQAYVKRRTEEEAAKGKTYVCDHIHDDCRWVADPPKQEKVLVKEGYWKTVTQ